MKHDFSWLHAQTVNLISRRCMLVQHDSESREDSALRKVRCALCVVRGDCAKEGGKQGIQPTAKYRYGLD